MSHEEYGEYYRAQEQISVMRFIGETQAKPTPLPLYAAWLCAWRRDGGQVSHWLNGYETARFLTPTVATLKSIPQSNLNLLIIPSLAVVDNILTTSAQDKRRWGNTTVKLLKRAATPQKRLIVDGMTNHIDRVYTFPEVEKFIKDYGGSQAVIHDCATSILKVMRGQKAGTSLFQLPAA